MNKIFDIVAGVGMLIAVFLFLYHGDNTVRIITSFSTAARQTINALQGR